jgi:glycosyltransferase involved in cell wall biosynthesis
MSQSTPPCPRVSICIPTFSRLAYLQDAVGSARRQSLRDIEIVIGDDGDSGAIAKWCTTQVAEDGRVRYEKTPRRLGLAGNWNFLAEKAQGEFLVLMGDDDRLLPEFAERLIDATDSTTDVAFANHYLIDAAGCRLGPQSEMATQTYGRANLAPGPVDDPIRVVWANSVPMMASLVRVASVRRLRFKEDINTPELELFARLAADGSRFAFANEYLAEYRVHPGSQTSGGLSVDRLAEYLQGITVPDRIEPLKRQCIGPLLLRGVSIRMQRGDIEGARALLRSAYYPRSPWGLRSAAQRMVLLLPSATSLRAYSCIAAAFRLTRSIWVTSDD